MARSKMRKNRELLEGRVANGTAAPPRGSTYRLLEDGLPLTRVKALLDDPDVWVRVHDCAGAAPRDVSGQDRAELWAGLSAGYDPAPGHGPWTAGGTGPYHAQVWGEAQERQLYVVRT